MAEITIPAKFGFSRVEQWGLMRGGRTLRSRFTGSRQTIALPYALWVFKGKFIEYPEDQGAKELRAFLMDLDGQANTFRLPVPGYKQPAAYTGAGVALTAQAAKGAISITTNAANGYIKTGEYFNIMGELKMATADAVGGVITFKPPLRVIAPNATALGLVNPYVIMHAQDDDAASWSLAAPIVHDFELKAIESF